MPDLTRLSQAITNSRLMDEGDALRVVRPFAPSAEIRIRASRRAAGFIRDIRAQNDPGLMEIFLAEYGLSTEEGVALMCLAEALLRVPDAPTVDALIEDKIAPGAWGRHLGHSASSLVNASTWALMLTGGILRDGEGASLAGVLRGAMKRVGEPVIRSAVGRAMRELGSQFVLGETITAAMDRGAKTPNVTHSFDMLGEAALTMADADAYMDAYLDAIKHLAKGAKDMIADSPGISIKLSALHPRYEVSQSDRVHKELVPRVRQLAQAAARAGIGLAIDAEEADRLELSLAVIKSVIPDPKLEGWDGFGMVVQAYGQRAAPVIDWFAGLAVAHQRKVNVRLVKGAYWDTEIKRAQVAGLSGFPVFTRKAATDANYLCLANKLLNERSPIFPQFATHNAQTMAAILEMAPDPQTFEFQRLHGMGGALHSMVQESAGTRHRIYAPVGAHRDLLAYLVRRLLENGANSSFVNQILDKELAPETVAADPFEALPIALSRPASGVVEPRDLFGTDRPNAKGWEISAVDDIKTIEQARLPFSEHVWQLGEAVGKPRPVGDPARSSENVGSVQFCGPDAVKNAAERAKTWDVDVNERARVLNRAADLYEQNFGELFALLAREAGKTLPDAISELREAVDFLRYYANEAKKLTAPARGIIGAISPWNFPLAIFTGQIAAALSVGNAVIAKPAESTTLVALRAIDLMHVAGVPKSTLQILPGEGSVIGAAIAASPLLAGITFTGSTATAQKINRAMAKSMRPDAVLIAETGGLNAMIVDSTALPEQAVKDIVASAFQSAGQRCSALRMLFVQDDVYGPMVEMLKGAMDQLHVGDPWALSTDVGPVIDAGAHSSIQSYIDQNQERILHRIRAPKVGTFVGPTLISVDGIQDLTHEVFGPVLHIAPYKAEELDQTIEAINATGYGLTFGLHSRIDARVARVTAKVDAGNVYVNRNQIGAVVGSQPFGGEGLSGTGPKAGGSLYLPRLVQPVLPGIVAIGGQMADRSEVQALIDAAIPPRRPIEVMDMPGPTGESNRMGHYGRGVVLCLGPTAAAARAQIAIVEKHGCAGVGIAPGLAKGEGIDGLLAPHELGTLTGFDLVADWSESTRQIEIRIALSQRSGPILLAAMGHDLDNLAIQERHLSVDTTAAGGNASLLASTSDV